MRSHDAGDYSRPEHPTIGVRGGNDTPPAGTALPFSAPREVRRRLELAVHQLNTGSIRSGMYLRFSVDYSGNPANVRVTDSKSGELVRSIPWTELLPELDRAPDRDRD